MTDNSLPEQSSVDQPVPEKIARRRFTNFLLDPFMQFRFAGQVLAILFVFALAFGGFTYVLVDLLYRMLDLFQVENSVREFVDGEVMHVIIGMSVTLLLFLLFGALFVVMETHKIVGAKYALIKHLKDHLLKNELDMPLKLRKSDYFQDVSELLNDFVASIRK